MHPLERLSGHLGGARIWAKRDDYRFVVGGLAATPYVIPLLTFLVPLMVGLFKSR